MRENMALLVWLETAVSGILFGPDQKAVRAELYAHIEDKALDLIRLFPDIDPDEARDMALAGMGDAEEIKKELARIHKPWLGWLWRFSQGLFCGALAVFLIICAVGNDHGQSMGFPLWMDRSGHYGPAAALEPERADLGGYTFRITEAAWLEGRGEIYLAMQVSSPRFWERIEPEGLYKCLTAIAPDGTRWPAGRARDEGPRAVTYLARQDLFTREFGIYVPVEEWPGEDWVTLELDSQLGSFTLSALVTERVAKQ